MTPMSQASRSPTPFLTVSILLLSVGLSGCTATPAGSAAAPASGQAATAPPASVAPAASGETVTGTVVETMNSGGYTYMRLQTGQKDVWIAATEMSVTKGERLTAPLEMPMANFHSNTLNRDFPMIYFVTHVARAGQALQAAPGSPAAPIAPRPMSSHAPTGAAAGASAQAAPQAAAAVNVQPNAPPAGGLSIAEMWAKRASLAGKPVTIRGTVVKVNNSIMGFNWLHLQDGSGKAADGTNDLTVTTDAVVTVGDVVTVTGTLAVKKDFGAGYSYEAILENATIK